MIKMREMNWKKAIESDPDRYLSVYDEKTKELIEVHDKDTGRVWFKINEDKWMWVE